ncbi:MAG: hypothetical protein K2H41_12065 [Acetatifactor sp.]|nr:hypothetical protein [Acetatifactor sp.]MDE7113216.1 hypothetical protein [Acetatifactor sp.]
MVAAIVHQLTRNLSMEEIEKSGFDKYYVDHTLGIWPQEGFPLTHSTYDNILRLVKDCSDVYAPIKFLREREIVHFQRFGEANREDCSKDRISLSYF